MRSPKNRTFLFLSILCFMVLFSFAVSATTLYVPGASATISGALIQAVTGDTILVAAGSYPEEIDIDGKSILLRSVSGAEATTIIGSINTTPTIHIHGGQGRELTIDGFTITDGPGSGFTGSAIQIDGASPTIINNIISDHRSQIGGGIAVLNNSSPWIEGNLIEWNSAIGDGTPDLYGKGGGIGVVAPVDLAEPIVIIGNTIRDNRARNGGKGGGVYVGVTQPQYCVVQDNTISQNEASSVGRGGGVYGNGTVTNNQIQDNKVSGFRCYGGGLYLTNKATATGNVIIGNIVQTSYSDIPAPGSGEGGGVCADGHLINNLIAFNKIYNDYWDWETPDVRGAGLLLLGEENTVSGNTIVSNVIDCESQCVGRGALGFAISTDSNHIITNNIVASNRNVSEQGGGSGGIGPTSDSVCLCNNAWGNEGLNYWGNDPTGEDGNISENPLFCGPVETGPFTLTEESPCSPEANPSCGLIGALPVDCALAAVESPDWASDERGYSLDATHPNPTQAVTTISFAIPEAGNVKLTILDVTGRVVTTLIDDHYLPGEHTGIWDCASENGGITGSGVYFYRLEARNYTATRKLLITR